MRLKTFILTILSLVFLISPTFAKDTLKVSYTTPSSTLHPYGGYSNTEMTVVTNIYDCLVDRDPDGKLIPSLATSWEAIDPVTWRFHIRDNVLFQNGNPLRAEDVKFSIEYAQTPISRYKFIAGKIKEVNIIDDLTLDIVTKSPWPILPDALYLTIPIVSKSYSDGKTDEYIAEHPMGTGPYRLIEWVRESHIHLEAYEKYWDGPPPIRKIELNPITNDATRLAGLITGQTDITMDVPLQYVGLLEKADKIKLISRGGPRIVMFSLRLDKPDFPTYKLKVRQAVMLGINEDEINERLMNNMAVPAVQLPAPFFRGYNKELVRPKYNPELARKLLAEAGYPNGFDIDVHVTNNRYIMDKEIGLAVAQQLSKIGIRANLVARPAAIHFKDVRADKLNFFMISWGEATFDSARLVGTFLKTGGQWGPRYSNPEYDKQLEAADQEADLQIRQEKLAAINKFFADNQLMIPLHYEPIVYGMSKDIRQFSMNVKKILDFNKISF